MNYLNSNTVYGLDMKYITTTANTSWSTWGSASNYITDPAWNYNHYDHYSKGKISHDGYITKGITITGKPIEISDKEVFRIKLDVPVGVYEWKTASPKSYIKPYKEVNKFEGPLIWIKPDTPITPSPFEIGDCQPEIKQCQCEMVILMRHGCQCGFMDIEAAQKDKEQHQASQFKMKQPCNCSPRVLFGSGCQCGGF